MGWPMPVLEAAIDLHTPDKGHLAAAPVSYTSSLVSDGVSLGDVAEWCWSLCAALWPPWRRRPTSTTAKAPVTQ